MELSMELMSAIQLEPFERIKEIVESTEILHDLDYIDYKALNLAIELNRRRTAEYLVSINCRVNIDSSKHENTPLHNAVELGDKQLVCDLLMKKASVVALNHEGNTPLHLAFLRRYDKVTELILNVMFVKDFYDYDNIKNKQGLTHMHIACTIDNERLVQLFLNAGANIKDAVSKDSPYCAGYTAMHFASENKCIEVAKVLMDAGGNMIFSVGEDSEGRSPARLAFENMKDLQILFYHITSQNQDCEHGYYANLSQFHMACLGEFPELVDNFILHGAALNTPLLKDSTFCPGYTPLHCAVESNCKENVDLLLQYGAKLEQMNYYKMTPLHLALYNENAKERNTIVDLIYAAIENKLKHDVDLNGLGYMQIAVTRGDIETVKIFLALDPKIVNRPVMYNLRNFSGFRPLHFAVKYAQLEVAKLLIKNGADVNSTDGFEHGTPLHMAFQAGNKKLIELLLSNGAMVNVVRPSDDKSMLHILVDNYMDQTGLRAWVENNNSNIFCYRKAKDELLELVEWLVRLKCNINATESEYGETALHVACRDFEVGGLCVYKLLEFGADINVENMDGKTPFQLVLNQSYNGHNGNDYMMLYHHIQKLKALGLEVNPKNEQCCQTISKMKDEFASEEDFFKDEVLARKHQERLDEIDKMKNFKLTKNVSLYDFVKKEKKRAVTYINDEPIVKLFEGKNSKELNEKYPLYAYLMKLRYRQAVELSVPKVEIEKTECVAVVAKKPRGKAQRRGK